MDINYEKNMLKSLSETGGSLEFKSKEVSASYKTFIKFSESINAKGTINNIRHPSINKFVQYFEELWEVHKNLINKQVDIIKSELDKMYINQKFETLLEIKHDILEEMYLSFSHLHGAIDAFFNSNDQLSETEKWAHINNYMRINRFKQSHLRSLITYIDTYRYVAVLTPVKSDEKSENPMLTLEDIAKNNIACDEIYKILINAKLIQKDTKIFIDTEKGAKVLLCAILVDLHGKGYYKKRPKNDEFLSVCLNSFAVKISLGTIKGKSEFPTLIVDRLKIPVFNPTN